MQYEKPKGDGNEVLFTMDEWDQGSKVWDKALVGYVIGLKPCFFEVAGYVKARWKAVVSPKSLRRGVFIFEFASEHDMK